jgi:hypothetical protein
MMMNDRDMRRAEALREALEGPTHRYLVTNPAHQSPARTYRAASKGQLIRRVLELEAKLAGLNNSVFKAAQEVEMFRKALNNNGVKVEGLENEPYIHDDLDTYGPS